MKTIFLAFLCILALPIVAMGKQVDSTKEIIVVAIDDAIKSLQDQPNQFNLSVNKRKSSKIKILKDRYPAGLFSKSFHTLSYRIRITLV